MCERGCGVIGPPGLDVRCDERQWVGLRLVLFLQLRLLKDAIWEAAGELQLTATTVKDIDKEDTVGVVLGLLRAVERRHPNGIRKWAAELPELDGKINYKDPVSWNEENKRLLRQLAHQLAKEQVVEELRQGHDPSNPDEEGDKEGVDDGDAFFGT